MKAKWLHSIHSSNVANSLIGEEYCCLMACYLAYNACILTTTRQYENQFRPIQTDPDSSPHYPQNTVVWYSLDLGTGLVFCLKR